jgi:hypothetical protein
MASWEIQFETGIRLVSLRIQLIYCSGLALILFMQNLERMYHTIQRKLNELVMQFYHSKIGQGDHLVVKYRVFHEGLASRAVSVTVLRY